MERPDKHFKFFRFRTPAYIEGFGVRLDAFWMVNAIRLIDFTPRILLEETVNINSRVSGFCYQDLKRMNFDDYETLISIVRNRDKYGRE